MRAFFSRALKYALDEPSKVEEPHWDAEDHLELPPADPPVVDPWEADSALDTETTDSKGPINQPNNLKRSPPGREARSANTRHPRLTGQISEPILAPIAESELRLSMAALEAEPQPVTEPLVPGPAAETPQYGSCPYSPADLLSEQAVFPCSTGQGEELSPAPLFGDCHEDETERINPEPDLAGTCREWTESNGSAGGVASRDACGPDFADDTGAGTGIREDDFEEAELHEVVEAVDVEPEEEEAFLVADTADEYFDYDADAHQAPWTEPEPGDEKSLRRARAKAAAITSVVEVTRRQEQDKLLDWLTELFLQLQHPATFRAIERIAAEGATWDLLQAVVALRHCWMERSEWWVGRYGSSREVRPLRQGSARLGWTVAARVCRSRADYAPEDMIDERWFDEWLILPPPDTPKERPGYFLFAAYVDSKVTDPDSQLLYEGLVLKHESDFKAETGEERGWWRRLPRYDEDIRFGFTLVTPFRDGFGPPGYTENQQPFRGAQSDS